MYSAIKNVIHTGRYELNDILTKIDTIWLQGGITETERTELIALARDNAQPENTYAPLQSQIDQAFAKINALETRVAALEAGGEPTPEPEEYPQWVQPTGAHDAYNTGDKVTYNGKHYQSTINGNVWSPDAYPAGWQLVE